MKENIFIEIFYNQKEAKRKIIDNIKAIRLNDLIIL